MEKNTKTIGQITKNHINRRLLYQLLVSFAVAVVMFGIDIYNAFSRGVSLPFVLLGIIIGILIGFAVGRMFAIKWHEDKQKIVIGIDRTAIFVIILYIAFRTFENAIFRHYIHGTALTDLTLSLLGGIMLGRLLSMLKTIRKILREQNMLS